MYSFRKSIFINRSQQDVIDFLSNPANLTKWRSRVEFAEWTSAGTPGIGSTYRQGSRLLGRKMETVFEITNWDPPHSYGYKAIKVPYPLEKIEALFTLAPKDNGTQLTFEAQIGVVGPFKFAESRLGRRAEKSDGEGIDTVKQLLEAG